MNPKSSTIAVSNKNYHKLKPKALKVTLHLGVQTRLIKTENLTQTNNNHLDSCHLLWTVWKIKYLIHFSQFKHIPVFLSFVAVWTLYDLQSLASI